MAEVAAAAVGGLVSGGLGLMGQDSANDANRDIADANNATSIELANTAHQREVKDLNKAGLNPILSAGGSGASVPSMASPVMQNSLAAMGDAMKSAVQDWSAIKHGEAIDSVVDKTKSETRLNDANALLTAAQVNSANAATRESIARIPTYGASVALSRAGAANYEADTRVKDTGAFGRYVGGVAGHTASSLGSSAVDYISDKLKDVISNINVHSAKKVQPHNVPSKNRFTSVPVPGAPGLERLQPLD